MFTKGILKPVPTLYNSYIVGIGLGTFVGNCVFIFGGQLVASRINHNQSLLNWVIGSIFLLTAVLQLFKIIRHKDTAHRLEDPATDARKIEEQLHRMKIDKDLSS